MASGITSLLSALTGRGGMSLKPEVVTPNWGGGIQQAPSGGGMTGGASAPVAHASLPGFVSPDAANDPLLSQNRPYDPTVTMNEQALKSLKDGMGRLLPKTKEEQQREALQKQLYGTAEAPGALQGHMPGPFMKAGQNMVNMGAAPARLDEITKLGMGVNDDELKRQKTQAEIEKAKAQTAKEQVLAKKAAQSGSGGGGKKSGGKKAASPEPVGGSGWGPNSFGGGWRG